MLSTVVVSALFAGLVAIAVTLLIERWGGRIGGVLGTIPTTIVPAAAGMAVSGEMAALEQSLAVVPLGMLVNAAFLLVFLHGPPRLPGEGRALLVQTTLLALIIWAGLGLLMLGMAERLLVLLDPVLLGVLGTSLLGVLGLRVAGARRTAPAGHRTPSRLEVGARGGAAALAIGAAVMLASIGLPLVAGLASVFPAIFLTTMVSLWLSQGAAVPLGAAGPMLLGSTSVGVYATVAIWSLPALGLTLGSIVAWSVSVIGWTLPCSLWISRRAPAPVSNAPLREPR